LLKIFNISLSREINYKRPFVYSYQKKILDSPARYTITEAATKIGKTASHIIWLLEQAIHCKENQSVWWIAPIFAQAEIAYNRMKAQISDKNFFKCNDTKLLLTLPTGAKIQFKSAERPDSLYGDDVYAAVFDEFTRAREEAWFALRSTLTATNGRCKFIGNVKGKKNWGYRLAIKAKNGEPNHEYYKVTAYDAAQEGLLQVEEIEQARRDLPESVFRELYLAEASEDGSNPFGLSFIRQCVYPQSTMPAVCFGIDLAKSVDYTVIIGLDKFGYVCHLERFQADWRQTMDRIVSLPNVSIKIDSTGVGDPIVEQLQARRPNVEAFKFSQRTKQALMEGLAVAIQQRKIAFPEGIIVDELEQFEFEHTRTGVFYSAPSGMHDDCVCALALAVDCHKTAVHTGSYSWV
jgi:phage FluMu gp28-like protein